MTTTTVTLTGDVADGIGVDFDPSRTKVWVTYNTEYIATDSGPFRLGSGTRSIESDGTFSIAGVVASTSLVDDLQATVHVDYADRATRARRVIDFGPYDLTAETGTVAIRSLEEVQAAPASRTSEIIAQMEAILADVEAAADGALTPDATTSIKGKVRLATNAETLTGTATDRVVTPGSLAYRVAGLIADIEDAGTDIGAALSGSYVPIKETGRRDISDDVGMPAGAIVLTRTNGVASLAVDPNGAGPFSLSDLQGNSLPAGFEVSGVLSVQLIDPSDGTDRGTLVIQGDGFGPYVSAGSPTATAQGYVTWIPATAFPVVLPGSPF